MNILALEASAGPCSAALCRDAGEGSVAAFVETAGAAAAVLVALPLLKMVLELIMGLL